MNKLTEVNITRRVVLSFAIFISILILYGLLTLYDMHTISRLTRTIYDHPLVVSNAALQSNVSIVRMHRSMKDVVLFNSLPKIEKTIATINHEEQKVYQYMDIVRNRILGEQGKNLENETRILFDKWRPIREEVIRLVSKGRINEAAQITIRKGADHVARLEEKMLALTDYARNKASVFMQNADKTRSKVNASTVIFLLTGIVASFLVAFFTAKQSAAVEKELWESRQLFTNAFTFAPIGMALVGIDGRFLSMNHATCKILGYPEEEMLDSRYVDHVHPDDINKSEAKFKGLSSGGHNTFTLENRYKHKDGHTIWGKANVSLVKDSDGKPLYSVVQFEDITEHQRAKELMKVAAAEWKTTFDAIDDSVCLLDLDGKILRCNKGMSKIVDKPLTDIVNHTCWELIHGAQKPIKGCPVTKMKKSLKRETMVLPSGDRWYEVSVDPVLDDEGRLKSAVHIISDITKKKRIEAQLAQAQKMESVGTLAGGIAHDFNNIIGIIVGNAELALLDIPEGTKVRHNIDEIRKASLRARDVVKQILSFSRQTELERKPMRLGSLVKEVSKLLRALIPTTIDIRFDKKTEEDTVLADPTQAHQVLLNLCTNASYAMKEKGGVLEISLDSKEIEANAPVRLQPGPYVILTVRDTGCGIDYKDLPRIFDPYFTTKGVGEGSGMGLAVVHGIVANHNGSITVESKPGKGTRFDVFFPRIETDAPQLDETMAPLPKGRERILLVDDETAIIDMAEHMLQHLGYEVVAKTSSRDALALFQARPNDFDLVITDQTMPHITGESLAKEFLRTRSDVPIIICTGYSYQMDEKKALDMGIQAFIMKPLMMDDVAKTIRKVLNAANG